MMASRSFFVASFALRIASASSGVIASVIYLNVADFTCSSWGRLLKDHNTAQSGAYRAHVDDKLPERLLPSLCVQIPESVIHGGGGDVNNTFFGTDPMRNGAQHDD